MGENIEKILNKKEEKPNLLLKPNGESIIELDDNKQINIEEKEEEKPNKNKKTIIIMIVIISLLLLLVISSLLFTSSEKLICSQTIDSNGLIKTTETKINFKKDGYYKSKTLITFDLGKYKENKDSILEDAKKLYNTNNEHVKTKISSNNKKIKVKIKTNEKLTNSIFNQDYENIKSYLENNEFKCK